MADTSDVQGYTAKFHNQLSKLRESTIPDGDKQAILEFTRTVDGENSVNQGTIAHRVNRLRLSSERATIPLTDMGRGDVDELLFELKHTHGLSEGTLRNYRKALRVFYRHRGVEWWDDISVGASPKRTVDPNILFSEEEISGLIEHATNPRDTALVALLADTGLRIGAVCSLRVKDVDLTSEIPTVTINTSGNVKGASGTVPLTWSAGYVRSYLTSHPCRSDPDSALIHKLKQHDPSVDDGALLYAYASRRVKLAARNAGIDTARVKTKVFRKTAISRWIREGMSEQAIKHRACWDVDTDMLHAYSGVRDEELNEQIISHYGIASTNGDDDAFSGLDTCPWCQGALAPGDDFCSSCGMALSDDAIAKRKRVQSAITDHVVGLDSPVERAVAGDVLTGLDAHADLVGSVADEVERRLRDSGSGG